VNRLRENASDILPAVPSEPEHEQLGASTARLLLAAIVVVFVACGFVVLAGTPPFEANDEPDHLRNVESLISGEMYRIGATGGLESHQPPLYYLLLAGYQRALGIAEHGTRPTYIEVGGPQLGLWNHDTPSDGDDQRFVDLMRITGLVMGAGVVVLAYATTRLVAASRATALIAAAIVATLPKFVFLSAVVNNDNLVNLIGAAVVYVSIRAVTTTTEPGRRAVHLYAAGLGLLVGCALATKLTAVAVILPAAFAVMIVARRSRTSRTAWPLFATLSVIPSIPWAIFTYREYDDPFAGRVSGEYFDAVIPGLMRKQLTSDVFLHQLPEGIWKTFWYSSGWNQYSWSNLAYLPLWLVAFPAFAYGTWRLWSTRSRRPEAAVFGLTTIAAISVFVYIGSITTGVQARVTFVGLIALAIVAAIGLERVPVRARLLLPAMSLVGTLIAIRSDVIHLFVNR